MNTSLDRVYLQFLNLKQVQIVTKYWEEFNIILTFLLSIPISILEDTFLSRLREKILTEVNIFELENFWDTIDLI